MTDPDAMNERSRPDDAPTVSGPVPVMVPVMVTVTTTTVSILVAMSLAILRLRQGLAPVGDSGSYLAGASGFANGHWFETPLVPSFSEISLLDTVNDAGWSPFSDFGVGAPMIIAFFDLFVPLRHAAGAVNVLAIGSIAAAVMVGPWTPRRTHEPWARAMLAIALSGWPILRFTAVGVLSEPVFCAAVLWLAVILARLSSHQASVLSGRSTLVVLGALTIVAGFTRFVGPTIAVIVALLLVQRGLSWRRAGWWTLATGLVPTIVTAIASSGTRTWTFHPRSAEDIFFLARGVGGWFEAGLGDQTSTLLRMSFRPSLLDWTIALVAVTSASVVMWNWIGDIAQRTTLFGLSRSRVDAGPALGRPLSPAVILATALALVIVPSMFFLDAILKLENRIMMPSGILVISAAGWWLAGKVSAPLALGAVCLWAIVATQPWNWLERPTPSRPTALTEAVEELEVRYGIRYVLTNQADLVWWHTGVPARYLPSGYYNRSDRTYDPQSLMAALPCALAQNDGAIVVDMNVGLPEPVILEEQLSLDVAAGRYDRVEVAPGIVAYQPTGLDCD